MEDLKMNIRRSKVVRNNCNKRKSQFNANFFEYAFTMDLASIRTFKGCNMAMVHGLRNKIYKAQNLFIPPQSP